uniref:Secreted protein n=1 Tax=Arion vulgaris TaxID=1028688 RepID=A0A0B7AZ77_9EUPU
MWTNTITKLLASFTYICSITMFTSDAADYVAELTCKNHSSVREHATQMVTCKNAGGV